tara:strand:+ start:1177 stop:1428 length:252 start_codon:yes stop_codon:yes gene_type:complete
MIEDVNWTYQEINNYYIADFHGIEYFIGSVRMGSLETWKVRCLKDDSFVAKPFDTLDEAKDFVSNRLQTMFSKSYERQYEIFE